MKGPTRLRFHRLDLHLQVVVTSDQPTARTEQAVRYLLHESVIDTPLDTKRALLETRGISGCPQVVDVVKRAAARGDDASASKSAARSTQGYTTPTPKGYATQALATPRVPSVAVISASQRRKGRKKKAACLRQPRLGAWSTSAHRVVSYKVTISKGPCQG